MKRLSSLLLTLLLMFGLLAGCSDGAENLAEQPTPPQSENVDQTDDENNEADSLFPVTLVDGLGDEVVIESKPEKIVSLMPSNTEIIYELGLGDKVVGVNDFDNYPEEVLEVEKVGSQEFNVEKIISLKPDLVLAHESGAVLAEDGLKQLADAGITVLVVHDAQSFSKVYETFELIGKATGEIEAAEAITNNMKNKLAEIEQLVAKVAEEDRKTVFVEVSPSPDIFTTGKNTFIDEMITLVNGINAAGDEEGWVQLSEEAIISLNPDVIVTTYGYYVEDPLGEVLNRQGWGDVTALKNEQVFDVHSDKVTRSGPRLAEGVEELAKAIYPQLFTE